MTRPFGAKDAWRLRRLQGGGTSLALEEDVLVGQSPLRQSAAALLVPAKAGIETYLLERSDGVAGFTQARRHVDATAAELIFIAPAADAFEGALLVWPRLLGDSCQLLGIEGVQRVYVALNEDDQVALNLFRRLGFRVYCSDVVFHRGADAAAPAAAAGRSMEEEPKPDDYADADELGGGEVRAERPEDAIALTRLRLVDLPSGASVDEPDIGVTEHPWGDYPLGGQAPAAAGTGWLWTDEHGDLRAAWRFVPGRHGDWLRLICRQDAAVALGALGRVLEGLGSAQFRRALFATARGYEPALHLALREAGFSPAVRRFRLVKHLTRRVLEPAWQTAPALADAAHAVTAGAIRATEH